jgi:hypothetical protein
LQRLPPPHPNPLPPPIFFPPPPLVVPPPRPYIPAGLLFGLITGLYHIHP